MAHRPRPLNHSEIALWREVTKSIRPLYDRRAEEDADLEALAAGDSVKQGVAPIPTPTTQARCCAKTGRKNIKIAATRTH